MRFLFDSAVVGVRPRMSAARKRRYGGRAVYCGKNERIRTGKNTCGAKIRAGEKYVRREERQDVQKIQAESVRLIFTGKFGGGFTRRVRMRIGRNGRRKSPARGGGRKGRKEALRTDKNGRGKSKPRARGKRVYGRERRIAGKQVKMNCFCGFFIQKRQIKAKKMRKTG